MKPSAYDADYISQATALGLKVFQCTEPVLGGYRYSLFLTRGPEVPVSEIAASRRHPLPGSAELVVDKNRALQVRRWGEELQAVALESGERVTGLLCLTPHGANALEDGQCLESGPLTVQRSGETVAIMLHNKPFGSVTADQWYAALIRAAEIMDEGPTIESGEGVFAFPLKPKPVELIDVTERVAKA